jgi:ubiquitin-protein ligase
MDFAKNRLLRDFTEICRNPIVGAAAAPLETNIFEWHCNFTPECGTYKGLLLHCTLVFPPSYPSSPPEVSIATGLPHSNILPRGPNGKSNFLCLDMLKSFFWTTDGEDDGAPWSGWSSAYTAKSVIMQLQSFLFEDYVENYDGTVKHTLYQRCLEEGGGRRSSQEVSALLRQAFKEALAFSCPCCGHTPNDHWPAVRGWKCPDEITLPVIRKDLVVQAGGGAAALSGRMDKIVRDLYVEFAEMPSVEKVLSPQPGQGVHLSNPLHVDVSDSSEVWIELIVDCSWSMRQTLSSTVLGLNRFLEEQRKTSKACSGQKVTVNLTTFASDVQKPWRRVDLNSLSDGAITKELLDPRGQTALHDAIGTTLARTAKVMNLGSGQAQYVPLEWLEHTANEERKNLPQVMVVILTDGEENSSSSYDKSKVGCMIETLQRACNPDDATDSTAAAQPYEFVFLGANQDAVAMGRSIGIRAESALTFTQSNQGVSECMGSLSAAFSRSRMENHRRQQHSRRHHWGMKLTSP